MTLKPNTRYFCVGEWDGKESSLKELVNYEEYTRDCHWCVTDEHGKIITMRQVGEVFTW